MDSISRRSFFGQATAGLAALAALGTAVNAEAAPTSLPPFMYTPADWKMAEFHQLLKHPARAKQLYDVVGINNGNFLAHIKNSLNGLQLGFGIPADQIKIVSATHGSSNLLNFDDYIWEKYQIGAGLRIDDPKTGKPATRNIFYTSPHGNPPVYASKDPDNPASFYHDSSIQALQRRGVQFLSCHLATESQALAIIHIHKLTQTQQQVVQEMQKHILPGVLIVPAMVAAIAMLQNEGSFAYTTI